MDFVGRIEKEREDLAIKTNALMNFQKTNTYVRLSPPVRTLLDDQLYHMSHYLRVLSERIDLYREKVS